MQNLKETKFSVAICVYGKDNPTWFKEAINSITQQSQPPSEVVIVVDGPVPTELNAVILEFEKSPLFKVIRFEKNQGHGIARRASLEACDNEIVALMDADDLSLPNRFETELQLLLDTNSDIVGGNIAEFIDNPNNVVGIREVPETNEGIKEYIKIRCPFNQVTVMFKKSVVEKAGGYLDWFCNEDYYLWLRMYLNNAKMANTGTTLVNVRVGKEMYQRRGGIKYFKSEAKLQKFMLDKGIINFTTYAINVLKRLIVQVLLPNRIRGLVFQRFARRKELAKNL